jgi:hypothetical protein
LGARGSRFFRFAFGLIAATAAVEEEGGALEAEEEEEDEEAALDDERRGDRGRFLWAAFDNGAEDDGTDDDEDWEDAPNAEIAAEEDEEEEEEFKSCRCIYKYAFANMSQRMPGRADFRAIIGIGNGVGGAGRVTSRRDCLIRR